MTRSAISGEAIAFSDHFDVAINFSEEIVTMLSRKIPVQLLTDSKSLFDVVSKGSKHSAKWMMIDISAAREEIKNKTISDIGVVRSSHNIADGLTISMAQATLSELIGTRCLIVTSEQWITRY